MEKCPVCGSNSNSFLLSNENVEFLRILANEKTIDTAVSMIRMIWENIPQTRLKADSREIADEFSKRLLEGAQTQLNTILAPMKVFIETFPTIIEKLPEDLRKDVKKEFQETRFTLESEFKSLRDATPPIKDTLDAMQTMTDKLHEVAERRMESIGKELNEKFKETLERMGFPKPEQLKLLSQLMPAALPLLEELLRFQTNPHEKGRRGEIELVRQLRDYYPEDNCKHLGDSGDTDIITEPRFNGIDIDQKILIESKKNSEWNHSFIEQVRKHMQFRGISFALLAVNTMPKGANGFMFEHTIEGVVLITSRDNFTVSYGAIRSALITLRLFRRNPIDLRKLFSDQRITEAIKTAYGYSEFIRKIRKRTQQIDSNAHGIKDDLETLDQHLKKVIGELQTQINDAILQINALGQDATVSTQQLRAHASEEA